MFFFLFPNYMDASWKVQFENTTYGFYGVDFVDTLHGWVVGGGLIHCPGVILKTKNGGINWDWTYTEYRLNGVCFIDNIYGWVVGDSGTILYTNDGGENWHYQDSGDTLPLLKVFFIDDSTGWVGGGNIIGPSLLHSTNGGNTWQHQESPGNSRVRDIHFITTYEGWHSKEGDSLMYYTVNGGSTWVEQSTRIQSNVFAIHFINSTEGWITGPQYGPYLEGVTAHTQNGGSNWEIQDSAGCHDIYFVNENYGWMIYEYSIYQTQDGGNLWEKTYSPGLARLVKLDFVDVNHGWAVGYYPLAGNDARGEILRYFPTGVEEAINETEKVIFVISPNPVSGKLRIQYTQPQASKVTLKLYNAVGRVAKTRFTKHQEPGIYDVELDMRQLPSGIYFVKFTAGDFTQTQKLILVR